MLLALIALTVATVIAYSYLSAQSTSVGIARNVSHHAKARYIAETGLELAIAYVKSGADWRADKVNGTWASSQAFAGGTYTIVGEDGEDLDGNGSITQPTEGDGDLTDDTSDPLTLTVTGSANDRTHVARATIRITGGPFIVNGNFEDCLGDGNDDPDPGWDGQQGRKLTICTSATGEVYEGQYSVYFEQPHGGNGYQLLQQITGLTPGDSYTWTTYLHMTAIEPLNVTSNPAFNLAIAATVDGAALVEHRQTVVTAAWQEITLVVTAPANGEVWVRAEYLEIKSGSAWVDAMTFVGPNGETGSSGYAVTWR